MHGVWWRRHRVARGRDIINEEEDSFIKWQTHNIVGHLCVPKTWLFSNSDKTTSDKLDNKVLYNSKLGRALFLRSRCGILQ